jgi:hypothetical protein
MMNSPKEDEQTVAGELDVVVDAEVTHADGSKD